MENIGPHNLYSNPNNDWEELDGNDNKKDLKELGGKDTKNDWEEIGDYDPQNNWEDVYFKQTNNTNSINQNNNIIKNKTLANALNGATIEKGSFDEQVKSHLAKNISAHKSVTGSSLGRFFMGVIHTIKKIFTFSSDSSVKKQDQILSDHVFNTSFKPAELPKDKPILTISRDIIEKAMGLKKDDAKEKKWPDNIYPKNEPRLSDIKQNANLQDCWFLSSVAATLKTYGPEYIKGLIQPAENKEGYNVRISDNIVHVPNEITSIKGKVCFSNSAPWVKILETAMQITLINNFEEYLKDANTNQLSESIQHKVIPDMAYKNPLVGMRALLGDNINNLTALDNKSLQQNELRQNIDEKDIKQALDNKQIMVLGSQPSSKGSVFRDGISPGHAVAVLDYNTNSKKVTILDPYGHTRVISMNSVNQNYSLLTLGEKPTNNNQSTTQVL